MKTNRVELKTSDEDERLLQKAAEKLEKETGRKPMKSRAILAAVKEYATSEPEMFFCNRIAIDEIEKHIEYGRELLQNVITEFQVVTTYALSFEQLKTVLKDINALGSLAILKEAINNMMTGLIYAEEQRKYPKQLITLDPTKLPDISSILNIAIESNFPWIQTHDIGIFWDVYGISEGKITVNPIELEKLCEAYRTYAVTSEEKSKLIEAKKLCRVLDNFSKNVSSPAVLGIPGLCYYDRFTGRFEPSSQYVKYQL